MKLVTFALCGRDRLGAAVDGRVVDLNATYAAWLDAAGEAAPAETADRTLPADMLAFLRGGASALAAARDALRFARERDFDVLGGVFPLGRVRLRAPVPRPPKIVCTGVNYEDYRQVIGLAKSPVPLIFLKAPSCVVGPEDAVRIPEGYGEAYHEYEFSCVIGKRCKGIPKERAGEVIAGYTIFDDITGRTLEATSREFQPWGKSIDTYGPMGPWIVTPDEMPADLYRLRILRRRNGKVEAESNTSNMIFHFDDIVAFASTFWTLEPGDLITTASPMAGPIAPGDVIEAEIEGIGVLRNTVESLKVDGVYAKRIGL
ncbi:MAG TPA: fumarylacetoacetate hydrolase family protein [Candidatus Acidoferrum sp.]|nr:fumarylacetoacetate hydrolase family protein [Candidatus Acidoferrum sp.]